jgi:hypothetical protein
MTTLLSSPDGITLQSTTSVLAALDTVIGTAASGTHGSKSSSLHCSLLSITCSTNPTHTSPYQRLSVRHTADCTVVLLMCLYSSAHVATASSINPLNEQQFN